MLILTANNNTLWGEEAEALKIEDRVKAYIENVERALEELAEKEGKHTERVARLIELARLYADDAKYYFEKGDYITALADIAYAEGLLDALRWLGLADFEWQPLSKLIERPKVVVAGTFDLIHPGHIALIKEAWKLGRAYVIVARDENVKRFKGREPIVPENQRVEVVKAIRYASRVILGSKDDVLEPIEKIRPDIILLGPDQWAQEDWLRERLEERGINAKIVRMSEKVYCSLCSTTEIACRVLRVFPKNACSHAEGENTR